MSTNQTSSAKGQRGNFAFMNNVMNPIMQWILRSPLHGLMSNSVALISVRGRKSGKAYTLPVQYAQEGQIIYILPGAPESKTWWRNLRGGAEVMLWLRGHEVQAQAELLTGAESIEALKIYYRRFPSSARIAHVSAAADGSFNAEELATATKQAVVVRVNIP